MGQISGNKQDPDSVARDMRSAKKADGSRMFTSEEFLSYQQIQSYFSRMAAKLRQASGVTELDTEAACVEQQLEETRQRVIEEVQLRHPIIYDNMNMCEMHKAGRLKQLTIAMLQPVCDYFDIATDKFNKKRKAEYITALGDLVKTCDCSKA